MKQVAYSYKNNKGLTYYLHQQEVTLRGGNRKQTIYYFAKQAGSKGIDAVPAGFKVVENKKTGLPVLKRT